MVNIDRRAVTSITTSFIQPVISTVQSSAADPFLSFTGHFSADGFTGDIWAPEKIVRKRKRRSAPECTPEDRCRSMFYRTYIQPADEDICLEISICNEYSKKGKRFWRRFRVPCCIFEEICTSLRDEGYYLDGKCQSGLPKVEVELLVLDSLRLLGSGCTYDLAEECTNVAQGTIRLFFQNTFCKWGRALSRDLVKLPETEEQLRHVVGLYERIGLPGCVGSVDCVHLVWDKCPAGYLSQCKGKEKHATLAFQAVVLHTKRILALSQFFAGATNDKSIARYDSAIQKIRTKSEALVGLEWGAFGQDGVERRQKGAYYICDGGYHYWQELIAPYTCK